MSVDFDYDENQGNPAHTDCLLSMETDNNFYVATSGALPWREPEDTPGDRMRGWWCAGRLKTAVEHIVPEWVLEGEHG
ncbi:hypothetical protein AB1Y20_007513 [Prymnesium parvum]|uniref:Uncharacterized protein n=1 Tax=Prymnesium parvum TaxID=97485 RepID=A0AB34IV82_PRYPA